MAGYSLGGNLALKLAGEYGDDPPPALQAVAAVSPILEIGECVRALERPGNCPLPVEFRAGPEAADAPEGPLLAGPVRSRPSSRGVRTVREFDEVYTAPHFGFADAEDYYHRASAMRVIDRIRVPALDHHGRRRSVRAAGAVSRSESHEQPAHHACLCRHGGHCGFVGPRQGHDDGYWAEDRIVDFVAQHARVVNDTPRRSRPGHDAGVSPRRSISSRAKTGPFPSSSCLK